MLTRTAHTPPSRKIRCENNAEEIARRLSTYRSALVLDEDLPLRRDYHRREEYKHAGAVYDGIDNQWSFPAGHDIRRVLDSNPEWISELELVHRKILLVRHDKEEQALRAEATWKTAKRQAN